MSIFFKGMGKMLTKDRSAAIVEIEKTAKPSKAESLIKLTPNKLLQQWQTYEILS